MKAILNTARKATSYVFLEHVRGTFEDGVVVVVSKKGMVKQYYEEKNRKTQVMCTIYGNNNKEEYSRIMPDIYNIV